MTGTALTKLLFLVILVFILCLPEFFIRHTVLSVSLNCVWPSLCGDQEEEEAGGTCPEQWQHLLGATEDQNNETQADTSCFMCEANVNMAELHHNSSDSAETIYFEVSLTLQQNHTAPVHLSLTGHRNHSQLLHLSAQEEGQGQGHEALLHCPPTVGGANLSCCLLLLSNRTSATGRLPWKRTTEGEWRCVLRATWLSLLCLVLLLIIITVAQQISEGRKRISGKSKIHPSKGQHVMDRGKHTEVITPKGLSLDRRGPYTWSELSSIEEVETPEETEVFFSDNMDNECSGNICSRRTHQSLSITEPS